MAARLPATKTPRDFVHLDELMPADRSWDSYFIGRQVWVYADEYRAELPGDSDYCRIIVTGGGDRGWHYRRPLSLRQTVLATLAALSLPLSETQLQSLGFRPWEGEPP